MKKSILFASLALLVYLISTILLGVWAKQLNLINDKVQTSFAIKEKFHHLDVNMNVNGYCQMNITEGFSPILNFENVFGNKIKAEHYVKNDTLFVSMFDTTARVYQHIDLTTASLESIKISSQNEMNVSALSQSGVLKVILNGKVTYSQYNSDIDTLNIFEGNAKGISVDSCSIRCLNIYHDKNKKINLNISRSPMPEINQFDESIISEPSE
jgi:hypothetical protein